MSIPAFLSLTGPSPQCQPIVRVHPVVIFSILDHYKRRTASNARVVGTLLGERDTTSGKNVVVVKNSFPVPHTEANDSAVVQEDYYRSMLALQKKVNPKQIVVGWYSSGGPITSDTTTAFVSSLLHDFYRQEVASSSSSSSSASSSSASSSAEPILLTLDVSLQHDCLPMRAYTASNIKSFRSLLHASQPGSASSSSSSSSSANTNCATRFESTQCELIQYEAEKIGVDLLISGVPDDKRLDAPASLLSDSENLESSINKLFDAIETVLSYIQTRHTRDAAAVKAKKQLRFDADIGAAIAEATSFIPSAHSSALGASAPSSSSPAAIQQSLLPSDANSPFHSETHDLLMLVYLAQMTSTQTNVADKIASLVL